MFPLLAGLLLGCGESTNPMGYMVPDAKTENADDWLSEARYAYDRGEFGRAKNLALRSYEVNQQDEATLLLLSKIQLSIAKLDPIQLAKKLAEQSDSESAGLNLDDEVDCSGETGAVKVMCLIAGLIGITTQDIETLSNEVETSSGTITVPKSATPARASGISVIEALNEGVSYICKYVDPAAKIIAENADDTTVDPRHSLENCPQAEDDSGEYSIGFHYVWGFLHFTEAVAFYMVINDFLVPLQNDISSISTTDAASFTTSLETISVAIDAIMPVDTVAASDSMLNAVYNNLDTTNQAFALIPGMPPEVTAQIDKAITDLKAKVGSIEDSGIDKESAALKNQLTDKITKALQNKIKSGDTLNELGQAINSDTALKTSFCSSYDRVTTNALEGLCD